MSGYTPTTPQEFLDRGAIPRPADGPNAKRDGEKCLTCIHHGGSCHGTQVLGGRCDYCRGLGAPPKAGEERKAGNKRTCYWLDRPNNVYTYKGAQQATDGRTLPVNTKAAKAERQRTKSLGAGTDTSAKKGDTEVKKQKSSKTTAVKKGGEEDDEDAPADQPAIFELPTNSPQYRVLQHLARHLVEGRSGENPSEDSHLNLQAIMRIAVRRRAALPQNEAADVIARAQSYIDDLLAILQTMQNNGEGLSRRDIWGFLPDDHPRKNERRPG